MIFKQKFPVTPTFKIAHLTFHSASTLMVLSPPGGSLSLCYTSVKSLGDTSIHRSIRGSIRGWDATFSSRHNGGKAGTR